MRPRYHDARERESKAPKTMDTTEDWAPPVKLALDRTNESR